MTKCGARLVVRELWSTGHTRQTEDRFCTLDRDHGGWHRTGVWTWPTAWLDWATVGTDD